MTATQQPRLRQFVVRLEQPGLYDELLAESLDESHREGRKVPMTDIARDAIANELERRRKRRRR